MNSRLYEYLHGRVSKEEIMQLAFPLSDGTTERHVQLAIALMTGSPTAKIEELLERINAFQPHDDLSYRIILLWARRKVLPSVFPSGFGEVAVWAFDQVKHKIDQDYEELGLVHFYVGRSHYDGKNRADLASSVVANIVVASFRKSLEVMVDIQMLSSARIYTLFRLFEEWKKFCLPNSFGWDFCDCAERYFSMGFLEHSGDRVAETKDFMEKWAKIFSQMEKGVLPETPIFLSPTINLLQLFLNAFNALAASHSGLRIDNHPLKVSGKLIFVEQIEKLKIIFKSTLFLDPSTPPLIAAAKQITALNERMQQLDTLVQTQAKQLALISAAAEQNTALSGRMQQLETLVQTQAQQLALMQAAAARAPAPSHASASGLQQASVFAETKDIRPVGTAPSQQATTPAATVPSQPQPSQQTTPAATAQPQASRRFGMSGDSYA